MAGAGRWRVSALLLEAKFYSEIALVYVAAVATEPAAGDQCVSARNCAGAADLRQMLVPAECILA